MDDTSATQSEPREAFEIVLPTETIRIAPGTRDIVIGGNTYTADPSARARIVVAQTGQRAVFEIKLPAKHAFVSRFMLGTTPPRLVEVNAYQRQIGGDYESIWRGRVATLEFADEVATFSCTSRYLEMQARRLPLYSVTRSCPHILYDANCQVDRALFTIDTTVTEVNGRSIKVDPIGVLNTENDWATSGELLHVPSGERITISLQEAGGRLTLQFPLGGLAVGHAVQVFAGCAHTIAICVEKFDNRENFGGFPQLVSLIQKPPGAGIPE